MSGKQETCWRYSRNPDDKNWFILAFVSGKGSCSLTRFAAASGKCLSMDTKEGDFQDNFADWLNPISFPLSFSKRIQLVEVRKEGLSACVLFEIKNQVIELAASALLGILDR